MTFKKLFRHDVKPTDGLTQPEREAIVDILNYCMFADKLIALSEDAMVESVASTLNWDPKISFEYYEGKSIGAVRRAIGEKEFRAEFMESLRTRLVKPENRKLALSLADNLTMADGAKAPEELRALAELKAALDS